VFGAGSGHANITRLRARNQGRKISVDFWLVVDPAVAAGDTCARVELLRAGILAQCTGVGDVVAQLYVPGGAGRGDGRTITDAPAQGWW